MAKIHDDVYDNGLSVLSADADELWILSGADEPADYAAALAVRCGVKDAPEVSAPQDGATSGRRVIVSAFNDGETLVDEAIGTRWGLVDTAAEKLLTIRRLTTPKTLYVGISFGLSALSVTIPDPLPE